MFIVWVEVSIEYHDKQVPQLATKVVCIQYVVCLRAERLLIEFYILVSVFLVTVSLARNEYISRMWLVFLAKIGGFSLSRLYIKKETFAEVLSFSALSACI